jgi:CRP-like cAMP-binding protein
MLATRGASRQRPSATPEVAERAIMMCNSTLFGGLSQRECEEIAANAQTRSYPKDETLYMEGHPARVLALILSGSVKISRLGTKGDEVILWMAKPGDTIGVLADSLTRSHTCSAHAMEPSTLLTWDFSRLQKFLEEFPRIGINIGAILSGRLNELQERFREVATEKVDKRVALAILRLAAQIGKPEDGGIEVPLTREELAQMTGTTLFSVSRQLSKWGEEGIVLPRREAVVVLDARRLGIIGMRGD